MNVLTSWTEERVERMTSMWADGQSASEIAEALGHTSRNAVIGKISRLGLQRNEAAVHAARKATHNAARKGAAALARAKRVSQAPRSERKPRRREDGFAAINAVRRARDAGPERVRRGQMPELTPVDASNAKPWLERQFGECAYPVSGEGAETMSCCAKTDRNYCAGHEARMFQPHQKKPGTRTIFHNSGPKKQRAA